MNKVCTPPAPVPANHHYMTLASTRARGALSSYAIPPIITRHVPPGVYDPEGPSTQYLRFLVQKTMPFIVLGTGACELQWYLNRMLEPVGEVLWGSSPEIQAHSRPKPQGCEVSTAPSNTASGATVMQLPTISPFIYVT